jgi:hypothetical protein
MSTWPELDRLIAKVGQVGQAGPKVAQAIAPKISALIKDEFSEGSDPAGKPWASLRPATLKSGRHAPPLTATGEMRSSVRVTADGWTIRIRIASPARYHQFGTRRMASRPIVPAFGLPERWKRVIEETVREVVAREMGR